MNKAEIWKQTRSSAIRAARQRAKDKALMVHANGLIFGFGNFGAIANGIREQQHWSFLYSAWIEEMDDLYLTD